LLLAYRKYGIEGLKPKRRNDKGDFKCIRVELENIIKTVISDYQPVSCAALYRHLIFNQHISETDFSYNTLRKYVSKHQLLKKRDKTARKKYEKANINELWVSDFMYGPYINKKRTFLCCILDDHSRLLTGYGWYFTEGSVSLEDSLKRAINRYGLPQIFYCDNGSAYISENLQMSCARLGIALVHTKPYDPAAKGKVERFIRTVRLMFLPNADFSNLEDLNESFANWVEKEYHRKVHTSTKETPLNRFLNSSEKNKIKRLPEEEIKEAFFQRLKRKVKKDSTISVNGRVYEVPAQYIGEKVEIHFASEQADKLYLFTEEKLILLRRVNLAENANFKPQPIFSVLQESKNV
jgi:transposase InsO family protein